MSTSKHSEARIIDRKRPRGVTALSLFFAFGALMSGLTATMLLFPDSVLEPIWRLNPAARQGFGVIGGWALLLMAAVCAACAVAALGLWHCTRLGYWTAVAILTANLIGDSTNVLIMHDWRTLIGLPIGAAMVWYLLKKSALFVY